MAAIVCSTAVFANDSTKNDISLRYGIGHLGKQDLIFSPFVHNAWSAVNIGMRYERKAKLHHYADLSFGTYQPILVPSYTYYDDQRTAPHYFILVNLTYGLGKALRLSNPKATLSVGGNAGINLQPSVYSFGSFSSLGYFAFIGVGAWTKFSYRFSDHHRLDAGLNLPLAGLTARSPYLINDDEYIENTYSHKGFRTLMAFLGDGQFRTLNSVQQADLHVKYTYDINRHWGIGAVYEWQFLHASQPASLIAYRNIFYLTGAFKF